MEGREVFAPAFAGITAARAVDISIVNSVSRMVQNIHRKLTNRDREQIVSNLIMSFLSVFEGASAHGTAWTLGGVLLRHLVRSVLAILGIVEGYVHL